MSDESGALYVTEVSIPKGAMVTHSVTVVSMMNSDGDIELVTSTRGQNTTTAYLGLLAWANHDILTWKSE